MSDSEWTTIRRTSVLPSSMPSGALLSGALPSGALPSRAPMRIPSNRSLGGEPPLPKISPLRAFGGGSSVPSSAPSSVPSSVPSAEYKPFSRSTTIHTSSKPVVTSDMFPALPSNTNTLTNTTNTTPLIPRATPISFAAMARKGHDKSEADIARAKLELEAEQEHQQREAHEARSILALRSFGARASRFIDPEDEEPEYVDNHEAYVGKAYESKRYDSSHYEENQGQEQNQEQTQEQNQEEHYFD